MISREVARHGGRERYRAAGADQVACAARERQLFAVERSHRLRAVVCAQLRDGWSPASIAGRLPVEYAADKSCRVSHEAIYQWVYAQPVSTLAKELIRLRTARTARKGGRRPPPAPRITSPTTLRVALDGEPRRPCWCALGRRGTAPRHPKGVGPTHPNPSNLEATVMSTLNTIPFTAAGNLTADPELRFTGTGKPVAGCADRGHPAPLRPRHQPLCGWDDDVRGWAGVG